MQSRLPSLHTIHAGAEQARDYPTDAEWHLMPYLLGRGFRFQEVVGHFTPDFYHPRTRLIVELDGLAHYSVSTKRRRILCQEDQWRDSQLMATGQVSKIFHFTNQEVFSNRHGVLRKIDDALRRYGRK